MDAILVIVFIAAPIVMGLVDLFKRALATSLINEGRIAPLASLFFGIIVALLLNWAGVTTATIGESVLAGILAGLSAAGLYSGQKALRE